MGGKAGRFVCIFVPMVLTIISLVFMIMIGLGGTNSNNNYLSNLYFMQINTTSVTSDPDFNHNKANAVTDPNDKTADGLIYIENFYTISLWNYCAGNGDNVTRSALAIGQHSAQSFDFCTGRQLQFAFPWRDIWGLSSDAQNRVFSEAFAGSIDAYSSRTSRWMSTLYILSVTAIGIEILVGIGGLFSRLGSLFTTLSSLVTLSLTFAFALLTTLTYFGMVATGTLSFVSTDIGLKIGPAIFVYMWLSVACSLVGTLFWAFSSCCCSGRPREPRGKHNGARSPYTYERMSETNLVPPAQNAAHAERVGGYAPQASAYEPYRHGQ